MSRGTWIGTALAVGFFIYLAVAGKLPIYMAILTGNGTQAPIPETAVATPSQVGQALSYGSPSIAATGTQAEQGAMNFGMPGYPGTLFTPMGAGLAG